MSPNDCTARRCAARPRLHGTTLGTNYPQCFYTCTNGCCIVLFASMKCLCPYHFRQLWELRSDFDTILSQKITSQFCIKRLRRLSTTKLIKFDKVTFIHHSLSNSSYLLNLFTFHIIRCHRAVVERGIGLAQLYSSSLTMGRFLENST